MYINTILSHMRAFAQFKYGLSIILKIEPKCLGCIAAVLVMSRLRTLSMSRGYSSVPFRTLCKQVWLHKMLFI